MSTNLKRIFNLCLITVGVTSLAGAGYSTMNMGLYGSSFQKIVSLQQKIASCHSRAMKSGNAYRYKRYSSGTLKTSYINRTEKCYNDAMEDLGMIDTAPAYLAKVMGTYQSTMKSFHTMLLRLMILKNNQKSLVKVLKGDFFKLERVNKLTNKELNQITEELKSNGLPVKNNLFLVSTALFMLTVLIGMCRRLISNNRNRKINLTARRSLNDNNIKDSEQVEELVSKALLANGMPSLHSLYLANKKHFVKNEQLRLKFDKIEQIAEKEGATNVKVAQLQASLEKFKKEVAAKKKAAAKKVEETEKKVEVKAPTLPAESKPVEVAPAEPKKKKVSSTDVEQCLSLTISRLSKDFFSQGVAVDVDVESGIKVNITPKRLKGFLTGLIQQSLAMSKDITSTKRLTISSRVIKDHLVIDVENKVFGAKEDLKQLVSSSKRAYRYPEALNFSVQEKADGHFAKHQYLTELKDPSGKQIGNRGKIAFNLATTKVTQSERPANKRPAPQATA